MWYLHNYPWRVGPQDLVENVCCWACSLPLAIWQMLHRLLSRGTGVCFIKIALFQKRSKAHLKWFKRKINSNYLGTFSKYHFQQEFFSSEDWDLQWDESPRRDFRFKYLLSLHKHFSEHFCEKVILRCFNEIPFILLLLLSLY